jgi:cation transport ATPase
VFLSDFIAKIMIRKHDNFLWSIFLLLFSLRQEILKFLRVSEPLRYQSTIFMAICYGGFAKIVIGEGNLLMDNWTKDEALSRLENLINSPDIRHEERVVCLSAKMRLEEGQDLEKTLEILHQDLQKLSAKRKVALSSALVWFDDELVNQRSEESRRSERHLAFWRKRVKRLAFAAAILATLLALIPLVSYLFLSLFIPGYALFVIIGYVIWLIFVWSAFAKINKKSGFLWSIAILAYGVITLIKGFSRIPNFRGWLSSSPDSIGYFILMMVSGIICILCFICSFIIWIQRSKNQAEDEKV